MIVYFKGTTDILGKNLKNKRYFYYQQKLWQKKGNKTKEFINREEGRESEILRDQGNMPLGGFRTIPPWTIRPDNSPPIFKQLALCSFIHYWAKQDVKCMEPRLNGIEIILRSLIHYQTNNSSFFYPLPSLKFGGELSDIPLGWSDPVQVFSLTINQL